MTTNKNKKILVGVRYIINVLVAALCGSSMASILTDTQHYKIMLCIAILLLTISNVIKLSEESIELK